MFVIAQYKIIVEGCSFDIAVLFLKNVHCCLLIFFPPCVILNKLAKHVIGFICVNKLFNGVRKEFVQEEEGSKRKHHLLPFITTVITTFHFSKK